METAKSQRPNAMDPSIPYALHKEIGYSPSWLLCAYEEHSWLVRDIGNKSPKVLVFNILLPNGGRLLDYANLYSSIKRIAYGVRTGPLADVASADVQAAIVNNLTTLACWMINNGLTRFSQLTKDDCEEYASLAVHGVHSIMNSESVLQRHLENLIAQANFHPDDELEMRRQKAKDVFPTLSKGGGSKNSVSFDRSQILRDACINSFGGRNTVLASLMDETEELCGLYQPGFIKNRNRRSRDDCDSKEVSEEHLRRLLMSFKYLYQHRRFLDDAVTSDPFPFTNPRAEARKLGTAVGRTGTIPVRQATHLIERSVRWVLDYGPAIMEVKKMADLAFDSDPETATKKYISYIRSVEMWPTGPACPFPIRATRIHTVQDNGTNEANAVSLRGEINLHTAIIFLMTSCAVVIAAFTARRASEIVGLQMGCVHYDDAGNPWLKCFIHKTLQSESMIPVPEVVVTSVAILEKLSERSRNKTETSFIFQYNIPGVFEKCGINDALLPNFRLAIHLRQFGYFVDVPLLEDGTRWTFKPHQFRRFFAILYIWIYDSGDWGALQFHLRHFTSENTRRYATENEIGQIIAQVDKVHTAQILASASIGLTKISGKQGVQLMQITQRLRHRMTMKVEVLSEKKFVKRLLTLVGRTGLVLTGFPWGFCVREKISDQKLCNCTNTQDRDIAQASEITCTGCDCSMVTSAAQGFLEATVRFHKKIVDTEGMPSILRNASLSIQSKLNATLMEITPLQKSDQL